MNIRTKGYKIVFSTEMDDFEIEEAIDEFLRNVDAKRQISCVVEMSKEEMNKSINELINS